MSCSLTPISKIIDVPRIEELLDDLFETEHNIVDCGIIDNDNLLDDWKKDNWDRTDVLTEYVKPQKKIKKVWLHECIVSLSPSEELLAIAKDSRAVFLTKKWKANEDCSYEIVWNGQLKPEGIQDNITCLLCIPLASQQRSSEGTPDWTCIVVGYASGYVRMYMPNGKQLLSQFLHDGPVLNIKIKTKHMLSLQPIREQMDELFILYPNAMVTIDGFSLYQSLRACRNQLAKAQANSMNENVEPPPLAYRKWRINEHEKINDATNCGIHNPCFFDRMQTASFLTGVKASVKGSSPAFHHFVATGKSPFISVYHALEGGSPPMISEVAMAVASKLTSAVFSRITAARGWFGGSNASQEQVQSSSEIKPKVEPGSLLNSRYCLQDKQREAEKIVVAPIGNLAVVSDAFNRVLLFDTSKGIVIRIWKGYRDAECGWVVVEEEHDGEEQQQQQRRRALFLIIYAPKRGILSIYLSEHGSRVGAFNVGKDCRLLYQGFASLGCTTNTTKKLNSNDVNQCFLLQSDGTIKSIHIPFHCALSTLHSTRAKDLHLLKKVTSLIERSINSDQKKEICKTLGTVLINMQVPSTQRNAVDSLLSSQLLSAEFMKTCLTYLIEDLNKSNSSAEEEDLEYQSDKEGLMFYCMAKKHLIDTYVEINELQNVKDADAVLDGDDETNLAELLHVTHSEALSLLTSVQHYKDVSLHACSNKILTGSKEMNVSTFLTCFDVSCNKTPNHLKENEVETTSTKNSLFTNISVDIKDSLPKDLVTSLGYFLFMDALVGDVQISKLTLILESSRLPPNQLMMVLSMFTQTEYCGNILELTMLSKLHSVVASLCSIKGGAEAENMLQQVGVASKWWQEVRLILSNSVMIAQSLVMAFICRSVAIETNAATQKVKNPDEHEITEGGWEAITVDMEQWNLLITQLEYLLELDSFVHTNHTMQQLSGMDYPTFKPHLHSAKKSKKNKSENMRTSTLNISQSKSICRMPTFSVTGVIEAGYGSFAHIVADCLVRQGVPGPCLGTLKPKKILQRIVVDGNSDPEELADDVPMVEVDTQPNLLGSLSAIRDLFPYSLEQDILWAHCAWECIMVWNEDVEDTSLLSSGLMHLSCIHNPILQQGLGVMMWRAVFKESIKSLQSLVDKVGKAPKDRLCRKVLSLSYIALQDFLLNGKRLLEILMEIEECGDIQIVLKTEELWSRENGIQVSIVEEAIDQALSNQQIIAHHWLLVVSMYLLMYGNIKSIKPTQLFDTKGKHALMQPLHAVPHLSSEIDDKIMRYREQFCVNVSDSIIKTHVNKNDEHEAKSNTSELLDHLNLIFLLAEKFQVDLDRIRRNIACSLYRVGLDIAAKEVSMKIEDAETFLSQMFDIIRKRLSSNLLTNDVISDSLSKLPTNISSWLQNKETAGENCDSSPASFTIPLSNTYQLLQNLHSSSSLALKDTKQYKFLKQLIDSLEIFV